MRHYKQPELSARLPVAARPPTRRRKAHFLQAEAARGSGQDFAFLFFTSGTTGPAKGVVLTHASLIDRARVAASMGELKDTDVAMAYLPPGWIGQNLFGYVQPMVVGYCICCPDPPTPCLPICARWARPISSPHLACWRRWPSRYRSEWRRPAASIRVSIAYCMAVGHAGQCADAGRRNLSLGDRLVVDGERSLDARPAPRRARDEQGARGLHGRRCDRSRSPDVFSRAGNQPEAALRLHRNRILRAYAARRRGQTGNGRIAGRRRRTENDAAARDPGALTRPFQGVLTATPRDGAGKKRRGLVSYRRRRLPRPRTGNCGSSTAWPMSAH